MKKLWYRIRRFFGFPVPPANLCEEIPLPETPLPEVAGKPVVFRDNPPERGPYERPADRRPSGRAVAGPPKFSNARRDPRPLSRTSPRDQASFLSSRDVSRDRRNDDLLDGLTALVLADALTSRAPADAPVSEARAPTVDEQIHQNQGAYSDRWSDAMKPAPSTNFGSSDSTRFDDSGSTRHSGDSGGGSWVDSVSDAVSSVFD